MQTNQRGQAFTLEGFIASIVMLTAVLLALQSIVITPTTAGPVDAEVEQQLRTEAHDILIVTAHAEDEGMNLSEVVRYWNGEDDRWQNAQGREVGYGSQEPLDGEESIFGKALEKSFTDRGRVYNVIVRWRGPGDPSEAGELPIVFRGVPSERAVSTSYTITLYDNQTMTGDDTSNVDDDIACVDKPLEWIKPSDGPDWNNTGQGGCIYPIPEYFIFDNDDQDEPTFDPGSDPASEEGPKDEDNEHEDPPIYNVIEIRVIVW